MAQIIKPKLAVGRTAAGVEFAEVSYQIQFSADEVRLGLRFTEDVRLWERDDSLDSFYRGVGSSRIGRQESHGNTDDDIGLVYSGTVNPSGSSVHSRLWRKEWNFANNESGPEEYRALIQVVPEVNSGTAWSNEVSLNLA